MRMSPYAAGLALVITLAGCGAEPVAPSGSASTFSLTMQESSTNGPVPAGDGSGVPATTTVPPQLTVAQAGMRYLTISRPYNVAMEAFERGFNQGESLARLRGRAQKVAAAVSAEATALDAEVWPTEVATLTKQLAGADREAHDAWLAVAAATTRPAMLAKVKDVPMGSGTGAKIRKSLGLPAYSEADY